MNPSEWESLYATAGQKVPNWPSQKTMLRVTQIALLEEEKFLSHLTKKQRDVWNFARVFEGQMQHTYYRYAFACGYEMGEQSEGGQVFGPPPTDNELMDYFWFLRSYSRDMLSGKKKPPQE